MDQTTEVAKVDRDYLNEKWNREGGEYNNTSNVGTRWTIAELLKYSDFDTSDSLPSDQTRFRLLDDDDEIYYGGWLLNDDMCCVQSIVLEWGTHDSGCTTIEIKKGESWVREIG